MRVFFSLLLTILSCSLLTAQGIAIGHWREHLNYQQTIQVLKGDQIYCATESAVFTIDEKNNSTRYTRATGLTDIGIGCIGWNQTNQQLIIGYKNGNIDILKNGTVTNIPDVLQSSFPGNKQYKDCYVKDGLAFLSTGLGVIVLDIGRKEIKETWILGSNGNQVQINNICFFNNSYYAATAEGLKKSGNNNTNLIDFRNWVTIGNTSPTQSVGICFNKLLITRNDSVYELNNNNSLQLFYADTAWRITHAGYQGSQLLLSQIGNNNAARVVSINTLGNIQKVLIAPTIISSPRYSIVDGSIFWVADFFGGLSKHSNTIEQFIPNGPLGNASGEFSFNDKGLFVAAGSVNIAWNYLFNRNGIYQFTNDTWSYKGNFNTPLLDSVFDFITLGTDPTDQSIWAGSYGGGLVHFGNTTTTLYKQRNSNLQAAVGDPNSYRVSGMTFDNNQNLWISNYGTTQPLKLRKKDGTWLGFSIPFSLTENAVAQLVADDFNQVWIMSPKGNGLICYNYGNSIDNTNDDQWKFFRGGRGAGNLPSSNVLSIAKDKNSTIWIGTDDGMAWIRCTSNVFGGQGCEAELPVVQQGSFNNFLLKGEQIQAIAVDGANRKWVGTKNGVWLIAEDGRKIIQHFTSVNSPLLHNDVMKIGINPQTGEVFFATTAGICSYRSTAVEPNTNLGAITVFPNPVPPNFNGVIGIRGLTENSIVKICEPTGRLVFQTRSLGGQATWDGKDYLGKKAASGVYLVLVKDEAGTEKAVSKIIILSGR